MGFGPPPGSSLFRSYRYGPEYAGLAGKDLTPGKLLEELEAKKEEERKEQSKAGNEKPAAAGADKKE